MKNSIKRALALAGYEINPIRHAPHDADRLLDDPREAFIEPNHRFAYAFRADLRLARDHQGFSFSPDGWHPFVSALRKSNGERSALQNELQSYYESFQPENAQEAIIGFRSSPKRFKTLPPYMFYLTPWASNTPESVRASVERWVQKENHESGREVTFSEGGFPSYGPVSQSKLEIETKRLFEIMNSLNKFGYDRSMGACNFRVIKLGSDIRLILDAGGYHRTASAAALSLEFVPGNFYPGRLISDVADVDFWPNVKNGLWKKSEAIKYVEHLFSFDSVSWARRYGLS